MEVTELKQVVDANAVEMRAGFVDVRKEMREGFADVRNEMREGFARMDRRFEQQSEEMRAAIGSFMDHLMDKVEIVAEATVEAQIDRKIAAAEVRLERKLGKR